MAAVKVKKAINLAGRMSLEDYKEINEVIRKHWGFPKEDFYPIDEIPYYGIEPDRIMITRYFPDSPGWFGDVCVVLHGEICFSTTLLKDGKMKHGWKEGWRIVNDANLPRKEIYDDKRYKKLP